MRNIRLHLEGPPNTENATMLLPGFKSLVFLVTWATFPNQGPELSNGMEERKLGIALATLAFFSGDLSDNGIQNCSLLRLCILYWSLLDVMFSVKLQLVECQEKGGGKILKSFEMKSCWPEPASYYLKDPFNLKGLLKGLTYKLTQ